MQGVGAPAPGAARTLAVHRHEIGLALAQALDPGGDAVREVFYAGLQTVPKDTLESAMVDGANRWERIRFVVIPYLMPLATFIALILLMDNFRVFEPIIGFSAAASATSLSYMIFTDLRATGSPLFGSAAASSMLTILGVVILLTPVLIRTWRDFNRKI